MADLQKIVEDLSKLTILGAADLAKMLEETWEKEIPTPGLSAEELSIARADLEVSCAPGAPRCWLLQPIFDFADAKARSRVLPWTRFPAAIAFICSRALPKAMIARLQFELF
jgi:hypothetical protein